MSFLESEPLASNLLEDDLDFDEIEEQLQKYRNDPHIKRAIQSPKDIAESTKALDNSIRQIEAESVQDCLTSYFLYLLAILLCRC